MISVAPIDNTSLVCDPSWVSNALEQAERLTSDTRAKKVLHNFAWNLLYNKVLHMFAWNPLYISYQSNQAIYHLFILSFINLIIKVLTKLFFVLLKNTYCREPTIAQTLSIICKI